ncbi:hypothetical protein CONPUDRAFT_145599 [Coniophora puteana RWD-64-598 SS2]|uniref:Uncharacterized protein n=1 Tax=Coniophora puteana (strain RWD-64-598) TaxID=741705 RepID=A0A5M3MGU2_CONPW|nr:uncharacterized protein CONPUDRAFT_145599 [Coniophora puteana RWD-64-598 SS2]EIW78323.1 hypothetical protein CONPUDRAFT_145599 [Coniophora puteana RWD-64-598 SS2]
MAVLSTPWYPDADYNPEDYVPPHRLASDTKLGLTASTAGILIAKVLAYNGPHGPRPTLAWRLDVHPDFAQVHDANNPFAILRSGWNTPAFVWTGASHAGTQSRIGYARSVSDPSPFATSLTAPLMGKLTPPPPPPPPSTLSSCTYKTIEQLIKWIYDWFQQELTEEDVARLSAGQITPCLGCTFLVRRGPVVTAGHNGSYAADDAGAAYVRVAPPGPASARVAASRHRTPKRVDLLGDFVKWVGMTVAVDSRGVPIPHLFLTNDPSLRMRGHVAW